ncbi:NAD(P)/FAD-dependent oxidoreductase [Arthrobacter sp. NPDC092385]|uniref:NAD(P)/FAD-dependent oxidoreductase n=1 Tax=Arthrobacter sp. NPDC092385 TaxID=3363943 RepID=UPI0038267412
MMAGSVRVVVVGGGYAGVMAANRLAGSRSRSASPVEVTLVDPGAAFTQRIRLHALAAGARDSAAVDWADVLHPRVRHLRARAVRIDPAQRLVALEQQDPLHFDWLVYAVGSGERSTALLSITNPDAAEATRRAVADLPTGSALTVAGAGPTGVELACALAVARPDLGITIVAPSGPAHPLTARPTIAGRLRRLGIAVEAGAVNPVTGSITGHEGTGHEGTGLGDIGHEAVRPAARTTVWTAGFAVPALAADSGLPVGADGRLTVDATLTVPGHERVVGAGDAVAVQGPAGAHLRASCATALPLGAHAADTVLARLAGTTPAAIDIGYLLQCLDLGSGQGHVQVVHPDDTARRWALTGRAGGWAKERVCRMTVAWLAGEARTPGSFTWPSGPAVSVH